MNYYKNCTNQLRWDVVRKSTLPYRMGQNSLSRRSHSHWNRNSRLFRLDSSQNRTPGPSEEEPDFACLSLSQ